MSYKKNLLIINDFWTDAKRSPTFVNGAIYLRIPLGTAIP